MEFLTALESWVRDVLLVGVINSDDCTEARARIGCDSRAVKILIADDHPIVRTGLRVLLEKHGHVVVGEAANGSEAVDLADREPPDIVLMDVSMPGSSGTAATRTIVERAPEIRVIALSMHAEAVHVRAMIDAGACGYVLKDSAADEIVQAVQAVSEGRTFVSATVAPLVEAPLPLSGRERDVLALIAEGHSSKEIAQLLGIALPTVETHRRHIMDKLGLRTIAELTKWAIRGGLTSVDR